MTQDTLATIEQSIKQAKELVDVGAALTRLRSNRDFKRIILDGYFDKEAVRLVHLKADPAMQSPTSQQAIISAMDAIGNLHQYLMDIDRTADLAQKQIEDGEQAREDVLNGEAE